MSAALNVWMVRLRPGRYRAAGLLVSPSGDDLRRLLTDLGLGTGGIVQSDRYGFERRVVDAAHDDALSLGVQVFPCPVRLRPEFARARGFTVLANSKNESGTPPPAASEAPPAASEATPAAGNVRPHRSLWPSCLGCRTDEHVVHLGARVADGRPIYGCRRCQQVSGSVVRVAPEKPKRIAEDSYHEAAEVSPLFHHAPEEAPVLQP